MKIFGIKDLKTDKIVLPVLSNDVREVYSTIIKMIATDPGSQLENFASDFIIVRIGELEDDGLLVQDSGTEITISDLLPKAYALRESLHIKKVNQDEVSE